MKKVFIYASAGLLLASCASDEIVDVSKGDGYSHTTEAAISFISNQKNITRAKNLQETGHYNFGVFAYKSTDMVNNIMDNYLVGYMDDTKNKGYKFGALQTTLGDKEGLADGASYWQYEGLGNAEYNYSGADYYNVSQTEYMSNKANQYLRYWDLASAYTNFIAYAPYINGNLTATYVDGTAQGTSSDTYTLTFPNGSITDGYDDESKFEFMYASNHVAKASYGHDVPLSFKRLNAKVNIKFWEDIKGYSVRILDLSSTKEGVQAAASIKKADPADTETYGPYGYRAGMYYKSNGVKIKFDPTGTSDPQLKQFEGTIVTNTTPLVFKAPTAAEIGTSRIDASQSATTYYAIPKWSSAQVLTNNGDNFTDVADAEADLAKTGFTFHVSYELTSDTGERIVVKNATVHVPYNYCEWRENTHYTYIFKITANTNGSTNPDNWGSDDDKIDPNDPEVPTEPALYPIIFDNCTVEDWLENESEWNITDGTELVYHDIQLSTYSLVNGDIDVTIVGEHNYTGATIDYTAVEVTPSNGKVTYNSGSKKITVADGAPAGVYTVTYTCNAPSGVAHNHPKTWTETFLVGSAYTVATNLSEVGTNGTAASKLLITTTMDGTPNTAADGQLIIKTPKNVTEDKVKVEQIDGKWYVTVAQDATPGKYELVYKVAEPTETKVANKVFEVVDYNFYLNKSVIELTGEVKTITAIAGGTGLLSLDADVATAGKVTIDGMTVKVANDTPEGVYNVYYTVNKDDAASIIIYLKSFEVFNTYAVSLNKSEILRDKDRANNDVYGSDKIQITTAKNGVNDATAIVATLTVVKEDGTDATSLFNIDSDGVLQVKGTAAAGNYKVKYVGQSGDDRYVVYAPFAVKK